MKDEATINWLFLLSAIYAAPHCDKWQGMLLGGLFCGLACLVWAQNFFKDWITK